VVSSFRFSGQNFVYISLVSHACYRFCPLQTYWVDRPNSTWWRIAIWISSSIVCSWVQWFESLALDLMCSELRTGSSVEQVASHHPVQQSAVIGRLVFCPQHPRSHATLCHIDIVSGMSIFCATHVCLTGPDKTRQVWDEYYCYNVMRHCYVTLLCTVTNTQTVPRLNKFILLHVTSYSGVKETL